MGEKKRESNNGRLINPKGFGFQGGQHVLQREK